MVLIDGEKLLDAVQGAINVMEAHGMNTVSATSLKAIIKCAPTIDAIPVEWLNKQCEMADDRGDMEMTDAISWLIQTWQEEQETQDGKA